jgi:hypothetical protein
MEAKQRRPQLQHPEDQSGGNQVRHLQHLYLLRQAMILP